MRPETRRLCRAEFRARRGRLLLDHRAQIVARDPVGKTGVAIDPLDAEELTSKRRTGQHARPPTGACRQQARRQRGDTAARNHHVVGVI